jgi:hypothetical protein
MAPERRSKQLGIAGVLAAIISITWFALKPRFSKKSD